MHTIQQQTDQQHIHQQDTENTNYSLSSSELESSSSVESAEDSSSAESTDIDLERLREREREVERERALRPRRDLEDPERRRLPRLNNLVSVRNIGFVCSNQINHAVKGCPQCAVRNRGFKRSNRLNHTPTASKVQSLCYTKCVM